MWIDITQPLTNAIGTWPGDTPTEFAISYTKAQTGSVNIGRLTTSMHTGTHADAPFHFDDAGETIEQLDVNIFIGEALVVDAVGVRVIDAALFEGLDFRGVQRVLVKTQRAVNPEQFPDAIPVVDPAVAKYLQARGIVLIGLDVPSVDALDSKEVAAHHALYKCGIHIVENLLLEQIEAGLYDFIGLPLRIVGADGAPIRAVVRKK